MTRFTVASFNVKNLIGPDQEYYRFLKYTPEEHAWKEDWLADQIVTMDADIVCFQEIFEAEALQAVIAAADARGKAANDVVIPDADKDYGGKAIFRKLEYTPYGSGGLAFRPADLGQTRHPFKSGLPRAFARRRVAPSLPSSCAPRA